MSETDAVTPRAPENLSKRTVAGLRWSYLDAGANAAILLGWTATSSRLLPPAVFGLMAVTNLVVTFGVFFARVGLAQALVQKASIDEHDVRASLTSGLLTGLLCCVILWLVAPLAAGLFDKPDVTPLLRVMGLSFVFAGLATTSQGLLRRELRFAEIAVIGIVSHLVSALLGIGLALAGAGVWSLIGYALSSTGLQMALSYARARHSLRLTLQMRRFRSLYSFGARVSLVRFTEFWGRNLDTLIVSRYLSAAVLGQYSRAYVLTNLPLNRYLAHSLTTVLFPTFSTIQSDDRRLKRGFLAALGIAALVMLPVCAGMAVAAPEVVAVVLGDGWEIAAAILPLFALGIGFNVLTRINELLCEARAELNRNLAVQVVYLVALAAALLVASPAGVMAMAAVLLIGEVLRHCAFALLVRRVLRLSARDLWQVYAPAVFAAALVAALVGAVRTLLVEIGSPAVAILIGEILAGAAGLALAIRCNPFPVVRTLLQQRLRDAGLIKSERAFPARLAAVVLGHAR